MNKKLLSTAVVALLLVSMLAAAAPAFAAPAIPDLRVPATTPTVPKTSGYVGEKVAVVGTGAQPWSTVTVYWNGPSGINLGTVGADPSGNYVLNVTIPLAPRGNNYIVVNDGTGAVGTQFEVLATVTASTTPSTAEVGVVDAKILPGEAVTLTGTGYAPNSQITITFDSTTLVTPVTRTLTTPSITTNASGYFSATVIVPSDITIAQYDTYIITATDAASNADDCTVLINYYITATPPSGPSGVTVTFSGRIPANQAYSIRIDTVTILTGTSGSDGRFSQAYTVPSLIAIGLHSLDVRWVVGSTETIIPGSFTVNTAPTVNLGGVTSGVAGDIVAITGVDFSGNANITLRFDNTAVNSTATDARFGPTTSAGAFSTEFAVPALSPGAYSLTVVDQYGATSVAQTFTVLAEAATTVALRGESYVQGDTLSFNIVTTETGATPLGTITVTIRDPSRVAWWTINWVLPTTGATRRIAFQNQVDNNGNHITLPADAPTGTWNWTVSYTPASKSVAKTDTGLFTVSSGGVGGIIDAIDDLKGTITSIQGDVVTIKTSVGTTLSTTVTEIKGKVTQIESGLATISAPNLGSITTRLSDIEAAITGISGDTATLKTSLGEVKTSLTSINAKFTSIEDGVATIKTDVGTIKGVVTEIKDDVVTIKTDVGTIKGVVTEIKDGIATVSTSVGNVQTSVSNLQPKVEAANDNTSSMSTMIYVAVAFAIIAAIAAVASILLMRKKIAS